LQCFLQFRWLLAVLISLRQWHFLFRQKNVSPTFKLLFSSQHCSGKLALTPHFASTLVKFNKKLRHSRDGTPKHIRTIIDATQKETVTDQQHRCKTLICQCRQFIVKFLSTAASASTRWRVRELYCQSTYTRTVLTERNNKLIPRIARCDTIFPRMM
jgi:hypothetical protein